MSSLPPSVDRMPHEPSALPPYSPRFLIALALSAVPFKWWGKGRLLAEDSPPVDNVMDALKKGGWKIVPMEREDYEPSRH